jgi:hypothetical protein
MHVWKSECMHEYTVCMFVPVVLRRVRKRVQLATSPPRSIHMSIGSIRGYRDPPGGLP